MGGLPISVELVHKERYTYTTDADLTVNRGIIKPKYTNLAPGFMFVHFFPNKVELAYTASIRCKIGHKINL